MNMRTFHINISNFWFKHVQAALCTKKDFEPVKSVCFKVLNQPRRQQIVNSQMWNSHVSWWPKAVFVMVKWSVWWARNVSIVCSPMQSRKSNTQGWKLGKSNSSREGQTPWKAWISLWEKVSFPSSSIFLWVLPTIESPKSKSISLLEADVWNTNMPWCYVTENRFLLRLTELYKWSGPKRQKVVGKSSHLRFYSKFRNPRTTKKTFAVPKTVFKKNL